MVPAYKILRLADRAGYKSPYDLPHQSSSSSPSPMHVDEDDLLRIVDWASPHLDIYRRTQEGDTVYFGLSACPVKGAEHRGQRVGKGKSTLILRPDGIGFSCFSSSCTGHTFPQILRALEQRLGSKCPVRLHSQDDLDLDHFNGDLLISQFGSPVSGGV